MPVCRSFRILIASSCCTVLIAGAVEADILENSVSQGAVYNNSGTVTGNTPIVVDGGGGTSINNTGTLTSTTALTTLDVNGNIDSITNSASGTITSTDAVHFSGNVGVVDIDAGATVNNFTNHGNITSLRSDVINIGGIVNTFTNTGTIDKSSTQTFGNAFEISSGATVGHLINSGVISQSRTGDAAFVLTGALNALTNTGTIRHTAGSTGIYILGSQAAPLTNAGTISSASARAIYLEDNLTLTFINNGSLLAPGGVNGDAIAADTGSTLTLTNNNILSGGVHGVRSYGTLNLTNNSAGVITGGTNGVFHQTGGVMTIDNAGTINGHISSTADAAHSITMRGGAINGNISLDGTTANTFQMSAGTITGIVDLGDNAAHSVTLSGGTIAGTLDMGDTAGGTATINPSANSTFSVNNSGGTALTGQGATFNLIGNGIFQIIGNVVDTGGGSDHVLDVDSGTLSFGENSTIDGALDVDGGTVDIGNNTISVGAASDFAAGSTFNVEIGTQTGLLTDGSSNTTITFQNGVNLDVVIGSGTSFQNTYTIADATGGTLNASATDINVVNDLVRYKFELRRIGDTLVLTPSKVDVATVASGTAVNDNIDAALNGDPLSTAINNMSNTQRVKQAFNSLESSGGSDAIAGSMALQHDALQVIENRILGVLGSDRSFSYRLGYRGKRKSPVTTAFDVMDAANLAQDHLAIWGQTYGSLSHQNNKDGFSGYRTKTAGVSIGADYEFSGEFFDKSLVGAAYSFGYSNVDLEDSTDETDISRHQVTLYGSVSKDNVYAQGNLGYAFNHYDGTRVIQAGAIQRFATSDYSGHQFSASFEVGKKIEFENAVRLNPYMGMHFSHLATESYTETGADNANLNVDRNHHNILITKVGAAISKEVNLWGYDFVPKINAYYGYDLIGDEVSVNNSFVGGGTAFKTRGLQPGRHIAGGTLGLQVAKGEGMELTMQYGAELKDRFIGQSALINLRYDFN